MHEQLPHRIISALLAGTPELAERQVSGHEAMFAAWALRHRLGPVLHSLAVPGGRVRAALNEQYLVATADELARQSWIPELLEAASANDVGIVVFKGLGIAHDRRVYAAPELRPLGDLDLLVHPDELDRAIAAAQRVGFSFGYADPAIEAMAREEGYQVTLWHERYGCLELHHGLYRDIPESATHAMLDRSVAAEVYGARVRRFVDRDLFYLLCVHLAKSRELWVWGWLMDLALLAPAIAPADFDLLVDDCLEWGGQVFVLACIQMLRELWGAEPPQLGSHQVRRLEEALSVLERPALRSFMSKLPGGPLGGEGLMLARRLSLRPGRRSSPLRAVICHRGAVCAELGVRSDAPGFAWHRVRHVGLRMRRGVRAAARFITAG